MRIKIPQYGDEQVIKVFLWLPKTLDNELRWLEYAEIEQVYLMGDGGVGFWKDLGWAD